MSFFNESELLTCLKLFLYIFFLHISSSTIVLIFFYLRWNYVSLLKVFGLYMFVLIIQLLMETLLIQALFHSFVSIPLCKLLLLAVSVRVPSQKFIGGSSIIVVGQVGKSSIITVGIMLVMCRFWTYNLFRAYPQTTLNNTTLNVPLPTKATRPNWLLLSAFSDNGYLHRIALFVGHPKVFD